MTDTTHLTALLTRLSNENAYFAKAKTETEVELRKVWISQIEKEVEAEYKFLGLEPIESEIEEMSDDDILAELMA